MFSQEVRKLIELAYSNSIEDKREAINKINELEARFVAKKRRLKYSIDFIFNRISQLPMGLGSLKHILKVEIIRAEQQEQNRTDENSSLQYACAVAVLK